MHKRSSTIVYVDCDIRRKLVPLLLEKMWHHTRQVHSLADASKAKGNRISHITCKENGWKYCSKVIIEKVKRTNYICSIWKNATHAHPPPTRVIRDIWTFDNGCILLFYYQQGRPMECLFLRSITRLLSFYLESFVISGLLFELLCDVYSLI